jgi:hypothetical protein
MGEQEEDTWRKKEKFIGGVWQCWEWAPLAFLWSSKTKKRGSFKSFWSFVEKSVV